MMKRFLLHFTILVSFSCCCCSSVVHLLNSPHHHHHHHHHHHNDDRQPGNVSRFSKRSAVNVESPQVDDVIDEEKDSNTVHPPYSLEKVENGEESPGLVCYFGGVQVDKHQVLALLSVPPINSPLHTTQQPPLRTRPMRPHMADHPPRKGQPNINYARNHKFRSKFQQDNDDPGYYDGGNTGAPEKEANYWLVPPFLIGASSIIFAYVVIHCLYTYCNCNGNPNRKAHSSGGRANHGYQKPTSVRRVHLVNAPMHQSAVDGGPGHGLKIRSIPSSISPHQQQQQQQPVMPAIILGDNNDFDEKVDRVKVHCPADGGGLRGDMTMTGYTFDGLTGNSIQHSAQRRFSHIVPIVGYDDGCDKVFGQNQIIETRPFLVFESDEEDEDDDEEEERKVKKAKRSESQRRKSALLQIPQAIGRRLSQTRFSFSSGGSTPQIRENHNRQPRASICFLPVARTVSDPSCSMLQVVVPTQSPAVGSAGCVDQNLSQASSLAVEGSEQKRVDDKSSTSICQQQEDPPPLPTLKNHHPVTTATASLPVVMISSPSEVSLNTGNDQDALLPSTNVTIKADENQVTS